MLFCFLNHHRDWIGRRCCCLRQIFKPQLSKTVEIIVMLIYFYFLVRTKTVTWCITNLELKVRSLHTDQQKLFADIYECYFDRLFAYALVLTNSQRYAEETVSEVFYNLLRSNKGLSGIRDLRSYLFASVRNQAIRLVSLNPASFDTFQYDHMKSSVQDVNPEDLMIGKELEAFVENVIQQLPPQCQLVYQMVREQHMKHNVVAEQLNISPNTVKNHMIAALTKIRERIEQHFSEPSVIRFSPSIRTMTALMIASVCLFQ